MSAHMQPPVLHTLLEASCQRMLALLPSASPQVLMSSPCVQRSCLRWLESCMLQLGLRV